MGDVRIRSPVRKFDSPGIARRMLGTQGDIGPGEVRRSRLADRRNSVALYIRVDDRRLLTVAGPGAAEDEQVLLALPALIDPDSRRVKAVGRNSNSQGTPVP